MEIPEEIKKEIAENYPHNIEICSGEDQESGGFMTLVFLHKNNKRDKPLLYVKSTNMIINELKFHNLCATIKTEYDFHKTISDYCNP